jgi:hypothetical protein
MIAEAIFGKVADRPLCVRPSGPPTVGPWYHIDACLFAP